jgi:hypothetical protein
MRIGINPPCDPDWIGLPIASKLGEVMIPEAIVVGVGLPVVILSGKS